MIYLTAALAALAAAAVCALCFFAGAYITMYHSNKNTARADRPAVDERASRQARIKQYEMQNFWSYDGDSQQDPAERAASQ